MQLKEILPALSTEAMCPRPTISRHCDNIIGLVVWWKCTGASSKCLKDVMCTVVIHSDSFLILALYNSLYFTFFNSKNYLFTCYYIKSSGNIVLCLYTQGYPTDNIPVCSEARQSAHFNNAVSQRATPKSNSFCFGK